MLWFVYCRHGTVLKCDRAPLHRRYGIDAEGEWAHGGTFDGFIPWTTVDSIARKPEEN